MAPETEAAKRKPRTAVEKKPAKTSRRPSEAADIDEKRAPAKDESSTKAESTPASASSPKKGTKSKPDSRPEEGAATSKAPDSAKTAGPKKALSPAKTAGSRKAPSLEGAAGPAKESSASKKASGPAKASARKTPTPKAPTPKAPTRKAPASAKEAAPGEATASQPTPETKPATVAPEGAAGDTRAENPLHRKLGIRPGSAGLVIAPPEDDDNPLLPLPDGFGVLDDVEALSSTEGQADYLHFFARNRGDLARVIVGLRDKLAPGGSLWVSWIKQSSSRRGEGLPGDLNENVIRRLALTSGLVDVKVASLDNDWSALKLVHRKH